MKPEQTKEETLFNAAQTLADLKERAAFLDAACQGDGNLRRSVEALLAAQARADAYFDRGAQDPGLDITRSRSGNSPACSFGDYELLAEIARGGQGIVYRARQRNLNRLVALKMIVLGPWATEAHLKRFKIEAEAAANLDHASIVPIYEIGQFDHQHYFTMKLIEGESLKQLVAQGPFAPRRAAMILATVARAIHYAHQRGILHRDIKPGNILLDGQDQPHVTDFGLAKLVEAESTVTNTMDVLGTPSYMSPEQASGQAKMVSTETDVYGLGAVLYELLTAHPPFAGGTTMETIRLVLEKEPEPPSVRNSKVDRDLETICLKCLEKDPGARYGSALGLAEDLERWLRQEPIVARPSTFFERAGKWARRKPVVASLGTATLLLLLVVAIGAPIQALRINRARQEALKNAEQLRRNLYVADINVAAEAIRDQQIGRARETLERYRHAQDLRGVEWGYLWQQCQPNFTHSLDGHSNIVQCATFSTNGEWFATADWDHVVKIWDAASRECLKMLGGTNDFDGFVDLKSLALSPDGRFLALKAGSWLRVWRSSTWEEVATLRVAEPLGTLNEAVVFSPDGKLLATRMAGGIGFVDTTVWRTNELFLNAESFHLGTASGRWGPKQFGSALAYAPDGRLLIVSDGVLLQIRDAHDPSVTLTNLARSDENQKMILSVASSKEHVAAGYRDGVIALWDRRTWQEIVLIRNPQPSYLVDLAFSPDGRLLATSGTQHLIQIWNVAQLIENPAPNSQPSLTLRGHSGVINAVAFSPDGRILASASSDRTAKLWSVSAESASSSLKDVQDPCWFSPDEKKFIALHNDGQCHLWDLERWQHLGQAGPIVDRNTLRSISPGGDWLALAMNDGSIELASMTRPAERRKLAVGMGRTEGLIFAQKTDEPLLAVLRSNGSELTCQLWNLNSRRQPRVIEVGTFSPHLRRLEQPVHRKFIFAISPTADQLAVANLGERNSRLYLFDVEAHTGHWLAEETSAFGGVAFSPDGKLIAAGGEENGVTRIWQTRTRKEQPPLIQTARGLPAITFSPDGRTLVTCNYDGVVRFWNVALGKELLAALHYDQPTGFLLFSPKGSFLAMPRPRSTAEAPRGRLLLWTNGTLSQERQIPP